MNQSIVKVVLFTLTCCTVVCTMKAQGQFPDGGFESWVTPQFTSYEEPSSNFWTTLNALSSLGAPVTVEKTSDAHSGSFAAKLTSKQWGSLLIPGLLVSGDFNIQNPNFLVLGQPFTDLPLAFKGWYKYSPVSGDSAGIATLLTRWNTGLQRRDTLALAALPVYNAQGTWTAFDLPFFYFQTGVSPDSILVAIVSSGDGQDFNGQPGSTLWIDDISLAYATPATPVADAETPRWSLSGKNLKIDLPASKSADALKIWDLQGRLLMEMDLRPGIQTLDVQVPNGLYVLGFWKNNRVLSSHKLVVMLP